MNSGERYSYILASSHVVRYDKPSVSYDVGCRWAQHIPRVHLEPLRVHHLSAADVLQHSPTHGEGCEREWMGANPSAPPLREMGGCDESQKVVILKAKL